MLDRGSNDEIGGPDPPVAAGVTAPKFARQTSYHLVYGHPLRLRKQGFGGGPLSGTQATQHLDP
jgi:hypothetical protein